VYDALTTKRGYKEVYSHDRAVAIVLESSGTQFDPAVVEAFVRREYEFAALAVELADSSETSGETVIADNTKLALVHEHGPVVSGAWQK
jgi:HD-GYP domain-containing protein (c-di-GMP phosphodiesterase class II)